MGKQVNAGVDVNQLVLVLDELVRNRFHYVQAGTGEKRERNAGTGRKEVQNVKNLGPLMEPVRE